MKYKYQDFVIGESATHQAALIFIISILLMQLFLPVTVVIVVTRVEGFL